MRKNVIMMVGLPATGKSTALEILKKKVPTLEIVSSDAFIEEKAKEMGVAYNEIFQSYVDAASKRARNQYRNLLSAGHPDIAVDRTNMTVRSRKSWVEQATNAGYLVEAFVCVSPAIVEEKQDWLIRLNGRPGKMIPLDVLENMERGYKEPSVEEGFNKIHFYNSFKGRLSRFGINTK